MKICKRCGKEKELRLFSPRKDSRDGLAYWCNPCKLTASKAAPGYKQSHAKYRSENKEKCKQAVYAWRVNNVEKHNAYSYAFRKAHPETYKRWAALPQTKALRVAATRRRQASVLRAMPSWLTQAEHAEIEGVYLFCQIFNGFQVDHIVPLKGKTVSGLHVPWNLQPLPRSENARKGAKLIGEINGNATW